MPSSQPEDVGYERAHAESDQHKTLRHLHGAIADLRMELNQTKEKLDAIENESRSANIAMQRRFDDQDNLRRMFASLSITVKKLSNDKGVFSGQKVLIKENSGNGPTEPRMTVDNEETGLPGTCSQGTIGVTAAANPLIKVQPDLENEVVSDC